MSASFAGGRHRSSRNRRARLLAGLIVLGVASVAPAVTPTEKNDDGIRNLQERIGRIREQAAGTELEEYAGILQQSWERGNWYLALARLTYVEPLLQADRLRAQQQAVLQGDADALRALHERMQPELAARLERLAAAPPSPVAAVRAVIDSSLQEARAYLGASLAYGLAAGNEAGIAYLGITAGKLDAAEFAQSLRIPAGGREPAIAAMPAALDELESRMLTAYTPPASIDHHPEFIQASASLKLARELQERGEEAASLYKLLDAELRLGQMSAPAEAEGAALASSVSEVSRRLESGPVDHSLGLLYLGRARMGLGEEASDEDRMMARVILRDVLPAYLLRVDGTAPSAPPAAPKAAGRNVRITLVRWPYT